MNAVELKNVSFSYDGFERNVLNNVNFYLKYGEVSLLSGHSGEGKSTILALICGIIPNVTPGNLYGDILIDGENVKGKKMSEICRKVGVVLQNADSQIVQKYVEDEIAFGCENFAFSQPKTAAQISRVCKIMKLDGTCQTRTLSGGQKQRLITASALATCQRILILDEPLANLDIEGADLLMNTLRTLAKAGYAVLVVEHRLDMVLPYVDSVWNIASGLLNKVEDKHKYLYSQALTIDDGAFSHGDGEVLMSVRNVGFSSGGKSILSDVSFELKRGERLLLLGENGCGKTTLLRLIARLCSPASGNIIQNIDRSFGRKKHGKKWFRRVGIVYQNPNYQLFMPTVEKEVAFNAISSEYAEKMLNIFGIDGLRNRHPQSLSEGQKRRVSIAATAAGNPELLLLDEPTVGQDYSGLLSLVKVLNELHSSSKNTIISVTHDMRCADALCDHAVWLKDGKVFCEGGKELAREYFFGDSLKERHFSNQSDI